MLLTTHTSCELKQGEGLKQGRKKPWISCEIISNIKKDNIILHYTLKIKFQKIFILISEILSPGKLDDQRRIIMSINSMLQKEI